MNLESVRYIDIHSHLNFKDYKGDLDAVLKRMEENGVATIVVGTDLESSREAVELAEKNENIFACIGAHPADDRSFVFDEKDFLPFVQKAKCVAVGECGLDYFRLDKLFANSRELENEKERQKKEFIKQIEFSIKYKKPLMLHLRDSVDASAYDDAFNILESYLLNHESIPRGNCHFFAGTLEQAKKFIDLGFTLSFTGVITFAREYEGLVKGVPLDMIHSETDSPFASPIPYRGKRNEPSYVIEIVKKIAEIKGEDIEKVRTKLLENARKTFQI